MGPLKGVVGSAIAAVAPAEFHEGQTYLKLGTDCAMHKVSLYPGGQLIETKLFPPESTLPGTWEVNEQGALVLHILEYVFTSGEKLPDGFYRGSQTYQGEPHVADFRLLKLS
jgi:hypothetical protein